MEYVVLRDEETGEIEKIGRFGDQFFQEKFHQGRWVWDSFLGSELLDGLLEKISKAEAEKHIALQHKREKIAA